jgi:hypothetical protein
MRACDTAHPEMRSQYEFDYATAVRGKHHRRLVREGSNVVALDPDVAEIFQDSVAVNEALRTLIRAAKFAMNRRRPVTRRRASD